jgi:hypothetical protein
VRKGRRLRKGAGTRNTPCLVTTRRLVEEARRARAGKEHIVANADFVQRGLRLILDLILKSLDHKLEPSTTPTVVARAIAAMISIVEDSDEPPPTMRLA